MNLSMPCVLFFPEDFLDAMKKRGLCTDMGIGHLLECVKAGEPIVKNAEMERQKKRQREEREQKEESGEVPKRSDLPDCRQQVTKLPKRQKMDDLVVGSIVKDTTGAYKGKWKIQGFDGDNAACGWVTPNGEVSDVEIIWKWNLVKCEVECE